MIDVTNLRPPINRYNDLLNLAKSSATKNSRNIKRLSRFIEETYSDYDKIITQYHRKPLPSRLTKHNKIIEGYFTSPPVSIGHELSILRNRKLHQCPFCGRPGKPRVLDHFIPKSLWPEFSIFPNNLVNQCNSCSSKKWNHFYCDTDKRAKFIHPYYSSLLTQVNFNFNFDTSDCIDIIGAIIEVKITISKSVRGRSRRRIRKHLKELDVKNYALEYAKEKFEDILDIASLEEINMIDRLEGEIKVAHRRSCNHWDGRILGAMLANADIKAHLEQCSP
ncbi:hypothetical protein CBQ28_01170 [Pseudoalteromonas sp. GCY]|uniref:HNH endonuclease n=1 Tax=Pseudoalteromonas sp. GCY TaxID=2003316 RepID=UPI000BFF0636|nr:HNH endonuclease [Pseudoalteromonas sp. GCY]PHI39161.1 hypothetical protein CBQ28_01170 [Pseudoalteromonas sp. GCY]QQQ65117.1 HNH endonuclease [Pseudoalteromonas sp. GCY]